MMRMTTALFTALALAFAAPAFADDDDDFLDDILAPDPGTPTESSTKDERVGLEQDAEDEMKDAATPEAPARKKVIKTLQRKNFLKLQRWEAAPTVGFVTNDCGAKVILAGAENSSRSTRRRFPNPSSRVNSSAIAEDLSPMPIAIGQVWWMPPARARCSSTK